MAEEYTEEAITEEETKKEEELDVTIGVPVNILETPIEQPVVEQKPSENALEAPEDKKVKTDKGYIGEIRGLLSSYPREINLTNTLNILNLAKNYLTIFDLLNYCIVKTTKPDIKELLKKDLKAFNKINIKKLRQLLVNYYSNDILYGQQESQDEIQFLLEDNLELLVSKVQFFFNCLPVKGKPFQHLRTAQGLPAATADEYETEEIGEGKNIKEGQQFRIEEGTVVAVD